MNIDKEININLNLNLDMNINIDIDKSINMTKHNVGLGKKSPVRKEVVTLPVASWLFLSSFRLQIYFNFSIPYNIVCFEVGEMASLG